MEHHGVGGVRDSVLSQEFDELDVQICIVDNSTIDIDWSLVFGSNILDLVTISKNQSHLTPGENFNRCIELAPGEWVHILHDDDWVLPGFYQKIKNYADIYLTANLIATRSFGVDQGGVIEWVSPRLWNLEICGRDVSDFYENTPIQCAGVVVKRAFYESHGGFRSDLDFVLDCEMWARAISLGGGVVIPDVLACYRISQNNGTSRLTRSGENLVGIRRLHELFAERYETFDSKKARIALLNRANSQAVNFLKAGDEEAAAASRNFFNQNASHWQRWRRHLRQIKRKLVN